jgi:nuclear GTP-binding protein
MILRDWIRGRIPYFRMPPMPNNSTQEPPETLNTVQVKQLYNKIFVTSAFSKDDLNESIKEEVSNLAESDSVNDTKTHSDTEKDENEDESDTEKDENEDEDWDNVFQNIVDPSAAEEEPAAPKLEPDSELEFSEQESIASDTSVQPRKKGPRMTTNKKKIGVHYYETANVKNKNRSKKRPLNPNEVAKRLKKKK